MSASSRLSSHFGSECAGGAPNLELWLDKMLKFKEKFVRSVGNINFP
jgi:hypothetical protein